MENTRTQGMSHVFGITLASVLLVVASIAPAIVHAKDGGGHAPCREMPIRA